MANTESQTILTNQLLSGRTLTAGPFGVRRIDALFGIEQEISGLGAEQQVAV